jgi:hypothetical protein
MTDKLPYLSDAHHYAIAAVAARAAQLDATIEVSIAGMLPGSPNAAAFILRGMNGDKYVDLLEKMLVDLAMYEHVPMVETVFSQIRTLRTERNEILHWLYGKTDDPEKAFYASVRPHREERQKTKTAKEIFAISESLLDMTMVVSALSALALKLLSSPYRPPQPSPLPDSVWYTALDRFRNGEPLRPPQATSPA